MRDRPTALFAMHPRHPSAVFPPWLMRRLQRLVEIEPTLVAERFDSPPIRTALSRVEVLVTGWGCPPLDAAALNAAPRLRTVLHAAGTVKAHITAECWARGIVVSSAADANAVPVAEYTLAAILLAGKSVFSLGERYRASRGLTPAETQDIGNVGRRVGIVGASRIGRRVIDLLRPFDLDVVLADPYVDAAAAQRLGVHLLSLDELLRSSHIVSLHAPATDATRDLLGPKEFGLMRDGSFLINTARGELVDTAALTAELVSGRISAVLDVTKPEPLPSHSVLFDLPNVFITPHVAGSHGNELERLGCSMVDELERLINGEPLIHQVHQSDLERSA